ncbi:hypothetical protein [Paenibacillus sp. PL91]|uniref:hypothetical protein n=1 Tax=Paenibacillus sp. PL91 TaxID=2729538 RepID=UPI00145C5612|nr:hypothetical protein [Paenibacillus sp. PL91]MBC9202667.1 hypothetical protein [Paenibacillus sp. PL91]
MFAADEILRVWRKFDRFPMETLTKAWFYKQNTAKKQREVTLMKEHYERYGITGNCFDLTIWLLHEFENEGIEAYPVGHDLGTPDAHVAVIAKDEKGKRYFCDLGDQWLNPIQIEAGSEHKYKGFFPAAEIQVNAEGDLFTVHYHRPNGKMSKQSFDLTKINSFDLWRAAEISQNTIKTIPLLECRIPYKAETAHWEFYNWGSILSTTEGLVDEPKTEDIEQWCLRINQKTGYDKKFLSEALQIYRDMRYTH